VMSSRLPYRGPLPDTAQNRTLARALGADASGDILVWPITVRDRVVAVLFGEHVEALLPEAELQATLREAGAAYARIILQARANAEDLPR
jgi:hypothetical protein